MAIVAPTPVAQASRPSSTRFTQLDSLRGLAALTVFFGHYAQLWPIMTNTTPTLTSQPLPLTLLRHSPLALLIAGSSAVLLFFVLSGFVLSLPFLRGAVPYSGYALKRICRIWLPYLACIVVCLGIRRLTYTGGALPGISDWFNTFVTARVTPHDFLGHLLLLGSFANAKINLVAWSLVVEMRISLLLPLLVLLVTRLRLRALLPLLFLLLVTPKVAHQFWPVTAHTDYVDTLGYLPCFLLGILLARHRLALTRWWARRAPVLRKVFFLLALVCYTAPEAWMLVPHYQSLRIGVLIQGLAMLGAAAIILAALSSAALQGFLERRVLVFLGNISYSFYLYHAAVLMGVLNLMRPALPMPLVLVASLGAAIALSALSYRYIELPAIALGKRLASVPKAA